MATAEAAVIVRSSGIQVAAAVRRQAYVYTVAYNNVFACVYIHIPRIILYAFLNGEPKTAILNKLSRK